MLGTGLLGTIVGVRAELEGFPTAVSGLVMSCYYVGFLLGCAMAPGLLRRHGHVKVFLAVSLLSALSALAYPVYTTPVAWAVFRLVTGVVYTG